MDSAEETLRSVSFHRALNDMQRAHALTAEALRMLESLKPPDSAAPVQLELDLRPRE